MDYSQYERLYIASINLKIKLITEIKQSLEKTYYNLIIERVLSRKHVSRNCTKGFPPLNEHSFH